MPTHTYTIIHEGGDLMTSTFAYDRDYALTYQEMARVVLHKEVILQTIELATDDHFNIAHLRRS